VFIVGLVATMAAGLYPYVLPARQGHSHGLTITSAATGHHTTAIVWWPLGIILAVAYVTLAYRRFFRPASGSALSESGG
jgi:cytochrome bd-type quinol oxidase subunit 2